MHKNINESASKDPRLKEHPIYGGKYRDINIPFPLQNIENPYSNIPRNVMDQEKGRIKIYKYDYNPISNKEHHYRYYQMITEIDQMVGELIAELEKKSLAKNTIIVYGSDHGLLMGEYGMGGKGLLYDLTTKFPCFIVDPTAPKKIRGITKEELVSSIDLTATLLDYANVKPSAYMMGRSLKPLVQGKKTSTPWRKGVFLENMYTGRDTPLQEGYVSDDGWKYIRFFKIPHPYTTQEVSSLNNAPVFEMLFNLKEDPEEKHNLAQTNKFTGILKKLRSQCDNELMSLLKKRKEYAQHYQLD